VGEEEQEASEVVVAVLPDMARAVTDRAEAAKADAPVLLVEVRWRVARATKRRLSMVTLMRNRKNEPNRPDLKSAALLLEKCGKKCERGYVGLSSNST